MSKKRIGILALQGDVSLHAQSLQRLGVQAIFVKSADNLRDLDGLIIPGGESTALLKLAEPLGMLAAIKEFVKTGGSVFGTCAGAILLAHKVTNPAQTSLGLIDITIERNGYGRQLDSSETVGKTTSRFGAPVFDLSMVFIRAPRITKTGPAVDILATYQDDPVLARQGTILAATFHPELTDDTAVYDYWLSL